VLNKEGGRSKVNVLKVIIYFNVLIYSIDFPVGLWCDRAIIMNVHHLELFYFVAKFEGITNAVRKMPYGIQQPAVSGQLLQLEKNLGVKLFNRRPFTLTAAGEELYDYVYPFFSKMPLVESKLRGEESNTLRIAASAIVLKNHLPIVLGVMKKHNPDLKLHLSDVAPAALGRLIQEEEVDLAVTAVAGPPEAPIKIEPLMEIPVVLLLPADAPEQEFADLLEDDDYLRGKRLKYPLVGMSEEQVISKVFGKFMQQNSVEWERVMQVGALEVIHDYVLQGFGIGIGIQIPGRRLPEGLRAIPLECPAMTLGVLYQGRLKPLAQEFIQHAREAAEALERVK